MLFSFSGSCWFSHFIQEMVSQLIFSELQLFFCHQIAVLNWDVKGVFLWSHEVESHEVNNSCWIIPSPHSEHFWLIHSLSSHEIIHKWVEIEITHLSHLSPKSSHFKFCLIVHLSHKLLTESEFPLEFLSFIADEIWSLL